MPKQHDDCEIAIHTLREMEEATRDVAQKLTAFAEKLVEDGEYHPSLLISGFLWAAVYMAITPTDADDPSLLTDEELHEVMTQALSDGFHKFRGVPKRYH